MREREREREKWEERYDGPKTEEESGVRRSVYRE